MFGFGAYELIDPEFDDVDDTPLLQRAGAGLAELHPDCSRSGRDQTILFERQCREHLLSEVELRRRRWREMYDLINHWQLLTKHPTIAWPAPERPSRPKDWPPEPEDTVHLPTRNLKRGEARLYANKVLIHEADEKEWSLWERQHLVELFREGGFIIYKRVAVPVLDAGIASS